MTTEAGKGESKSKDATTDVVPYELKHTGPDDIRDIGIYNRDRALLEQLMESYPSLGTETHAKTGKNLPVKLQDHLFAFLSMKLPEWVDQYQAMVPGLTAELTRTPNPYEVAAKLIEASAGIDAPVAPTALQRAKTGTGSATDLAATA